MEPLDRMDLAGWGPGVRNVAGRCNDLGSSRDGGPATRGRPYPQPSGPDTVPPAVCGLAHGTGLAGLRDWQDPAFPLGWQCLVDPRWSAHVLCWLPTSPVEGHQMRSGTGAEGDSRHRLSSDASRRGSGTDWCQPGSDPRRPRRPRRRPAPTDVALGASWRDDVAGVDALASGARS